MGIPPAHIQTPQTIASGYVLIARTLQATLIANALTLSRRTVYSRHFSCQTSNLRHRLEPEHLDLAPALHSFVSRPSLVSGSSISSREGKTINSGLPAAPTPTQV